MGKDSRRLRIKPEAWNYKHFGNIFHRKKRIMARLEGSANRLGRSDDRHLQKLQKKLWREYGKILLQEEAYGIGKLDKTRSSLVTKILISFMDLL